MSLGYLRHKWNDYLAEHLAPMLAARASLACLNNRIIRCRPDIDPSLKGTIPVHAEARLTPVPPEEYADHAGKG